MIAARTRQVLAVAGLCVITLLVYANSFDSGFVLDNDFLLTEDRIQAATAANVRLIWEHTYWWPAGESGLYRPFTTLTYLFNWAILGNRDLPAGYHCINLGLHVVNVLLAYAVALRILRQFRLALFAAGLWAVHPVLTESVTNIVGRAELLSGMSVLGGLLMYLKSRDCTGWRQWAWLGGLMAITTVGVFSKETAVTIVGVVAIYEAVYWRGWEQGREQVRGLLLGWAAMLPPVAWMLYQRWTVLGASQPTVFPFVDNPLMGAGFLTARLTAVKVLARYLGLVVWPVVLSCDYSYRQIPLANGSWEDWIAWVTVAAAAVGVALLYRWNRAAFFFALFAFVTLLPGSNLVMTIGTIMAERLLYLPAFGVLVVLVMGMDAFTRRTGVKVLAPVLMCLIAVAFGVRTWARNPDWRTEITIGEAAVRASPRSFKVYGLLADALTQADTLHENLDREIAVSEQGVAVLDSLPDWLNTWRSYSQTAGYYKQKAELLSQKRWDGTVAPPEESQRAWRQVVKLLLRSVAIVKAEPQPVVPKGVFVAQVILGDEYRTLSTAYSRLGEPQKAYELAAKARECDPMFPGSYSRLSVALLDLGRAREAALVRMEGWALTEDAGLDGGLAAIYRKNKDLDPQGCAVVPVLEVISHDPSCEAMRVLRCDAMEKAFQRAISVGRKVRAAKIRKESGEWRCGEGNGARS